MKTRWRLVVEYDGTDFAGWQVQPEARTVQGVLQETLAGWLGHPVRITASGRTDAGVHALGQVASFVTEVDRPARAMRDGVNVQLPRDVAIVDAAAVPEAFDPRRWARGKHYRYRWLVRPARSPLRERYCWHVPRGLDAEAMAAGAVHLAGWHDFSSFRASGCQATHPRRHVTDIAVRRHEDEVHLDIRGQGFLRHMVRIIAGTLTEVGRGGRSPGWVREVQEARDRSAGGRTAPARGLTLVEVAYGAGPPEWVREGAPVEGLD